MSRYELDVRLVREMGRYDEIWGDTVREMYQEIWRDMARYGEIWRDMARYGEPSDLVSVDLCVSVLRLPVRAVWGVGLCGCVSAPTCAAARPAARTSLRRRSPTGRFQERSRKGLGKGWERSRKGLGKV